MRDSAGLTGLDGVNYLASVPKGEVITFMCVVGDELYVSSNKHIYVLVDKKRLERK